MQFACKKVSLRDILKCSFNINKTEYDILIILIRSNTKLTISELSNLLNLTKSSVQKAIKLLFIKGLINRNKLNNKRGGYFYNYFIKNKKEIKELLIRNTDEWASDIKKKIINL